MDYGLLSQYLGPPSQEDKQKAIQMGLLQAGLGILANNQSRNLAPALGTGGLMGLQGYQGALNQAQQQRQAQLPVMMKMAEMKRTEDQRNALSRVMGSGGPRPPLETQVGMKTSHAPTGDDVNAFRPGFNPLAAREYLDLGGDPTKLKDLRSITQDQYKERDTGTMIERYNTDTGQVVERIPKSQFGQQAPWKFSDLTPAQAREAELQQTAAGRASTVTNVINAGPKAFETELGKMDAEKLGEYRKNAEAANSTLQTVANMRTAINQGVYSGGGAQTKMAAANFVNGLTGITPKGLPGSQQFNAEASKLVLDKIKLLGSQPSDADREFIERTIPNLATSQEARDQLISYLEQASTRQIDFYRQADAHARRNHGLGGFDVAPSPGKPASGQSRPTMLPKGVKVTRDD
jgi:hypothetical protein